MFTVKVVRPNGNEDLYEALDITKETDALIMMIGDHRECVEIGRGGQLTGVASAELDGDSERPSVLRGRTQEHLELATVYVMNRYGSTVATYQI